MKKYVFLLATIGLALSGCAEQKIAEMLTSGKFQPFKFAKVWLEDINFIADKNMNNNHPVEVNIVVAFNDTILAVLMKLPAEDYFRKLDQLKRDAPEQFDVFRWEIIPGQRLMKQKVTPSHTGGVGVVAFARYNHPGHHRLAILSDRAINIRLGKDGFIKEKRH